MASERQSWAPNPGGPAPGTVLSRDVPFSSGRQHRGWGTCKGLHFTPARRGRRPSTGREPSAPGRHPACPAPRRAPLAARDTEVLPDLRQSQPSLIVRTVVAQGPGDNRSLRSGAHLGPAGRPQRSESSHDGPQSRRTRTAPSCRAGPARVLARVSTALGGGGESGEGAGRVRLLVSQVSPRVMLLRLGV